MLIVDLGDPRAFVLMPQGLASHGVSSREQLRRPRPPQLAGRISRNTRFGSVTTPPYLIRRKGVALCLSGGGYRAALFHLGALQRLDEIGLLTQVTTVSSVSGGSIVAGLLADPRLDWQRPQLGGFVEHVEGALLELTRHNIRTVALTARARPSNVLRGGASLKALERQLVKYVPHLGRHLSEIQGQGPALNIAATELTTLDGWYFLTPRMDHPHGRVGGPGVGYDIPAPGDTLATAIATSAAFPPFFSPRIVDLTAGQWKTGVHGQLGRPLLLDRCQLTDGGVIDNTALESVWRNHGTVFLSDASAFSGAAPLIIRTRLGIATRALAATTAQTASIRRRWLLTQYARGVVAGGLWSIDLTPDHGFREETVKAIASVRTDLDAFSEHEQMALVRQGYFAASAAHLVDVEEGHVAPGPRPEPNAEQRMLRHLSRSHKRTLLGRY